jgi:NNP family nitrate/nitrite transporter-like MFS transporter
MSETLVGREPVAAPALGDGEAAADLQMAPGRWINRWEPENPLFWDRIGSKVANRNLWASIFAEHIGFSVWTMWSSLVLFLGPKYGFSAADKFLLTSTPALVGSVLRVPYTFAIARFGGRNWTVFSASVLIIPMLLTLVVLKPGVSLGTLLLVAGVAGLGGGNFASAMANTNQYFPERRKGWALGLNAGGGNIGVAAVQLVALLVLATAGKDHPRVLVAVYIPLLAIAAVIAALSMDNLATAKNAKGAMREVAKDRHTWIIALLYIGTFGSFIGFGFAFGQVLTVQFKADFDTPIKAAYLTFLGPLLGSLIRPLGGMLADRIGGAKVSFCNFIAMALAAALVLTASLQKSLPLFVGAFVALFVFSGVGNGSVYKMIPAIFKAKARLQDAQGAETALTEIHARRLSSALIGLAGAIGAFGGVLVNIAFRQSFLSYKTGNAAYIGFLAFYAVCVAVTWFVYLRRSPGKLAGV